MSDRFRRKKGLKLVPQESWANPRAVRIPRLWVIPPDGRFRPPQEAFRTIFHGEKPQAPKKKPSQTSLALVGSTKHPKVCYSFRPSHAHNPSIARYLSIERLPRPCVMWPKYKWKYNYNNYYYSSLQMELQLQIQNTAVTRASMGWKMSRKIRTEICCDSVSY